MKVYLGARLGGKHNRKSAVEREKKARGNPQMLRTLEIAEKKNGGKGVGYFFFYIGEAEPANLEG